VVYLRATRNTVRPPVPCDEQLDDARLAVGETLIRLRLPRMSPEQLRAPSVCHPGSVISSTGVRARGQCVGLNESIAGRFREWRARPREMPYDRALDVDVGDGLAHEMEREIPVGAKLLLAASRANTPLFARTTAMSSPAACGARTSKASAVLVVAAIQDLRRGHDRVLSAMSGREGAHDKERVAPQMLQLGAACRRNAGGRRRRYLLKQVWTENRFSGTDP